jgi:integrase
MAKRRANGEGSIYQRKSDGRWVASISVGGMKRKHILGHSHAEVAAKKAALLADRDKGIPIPTSTQTLAQYFDFWLNSVRESVRPRAYESYDLNARRLKPLIGKAKLSALSPAAIETAYAKLLQQGLARRTVSQAHSVLHNALEKAVEWGLIGRNPSEYASVPRPERNEMKTLSEEQVRRLFVATRDDEFYALWVVLASTGLRLGEALGLQWDDIDFVHERLFVRRALQRQKSVGLVFVEPKTKKSRRTVYFPAGTGATLQEHRRKQLELRLKLGSAWDDRDLVFCRAGKPLDPGAMSYWLKKALKAAGLPEIRVHDLRHTAATLHLARGENPKVVQELLGHSTIALTMDTYSHVSPAIHAGAASKMQALFT